MQPITTTVMDLHLEVVMTYTLQIMPVTITTVTSIAPVTMTFTVAVTTGPEATISVPIM